MPVAGFCLRQLRAALRAALSNELSLLLKCFHFFIEFVYKKFPLLRSSVKKLRSEYVYGGDGQEKAEQDKRAARAFIVNARSDSLSLSALFLPVNIFYIFIKINN